MIVIIILLSDLPEYLPIITIDLYHKSSQFCESECNEICHEDKINEVEIMK